ncbi:MAG: NHLP bacteriocin system secretion protein [Xenococcus sp. (in: cyanobacteria)]
MSPSSTSSSSAQKAKASQGSPNGDSTNASVAKLKVSPPPKTKLIARLLPTISLTVLAGFWSVVGRIPIRVVGQSILIQPRSIISFQPRGSGGQVQELRVKPGDRVNVGQVIAVIDLPDLQEQLANQKQKLTEYELENLAITNAQKIRSDLQEQTLELESISLPQQIDANLKQIEANEKAMIAVKKQRAAYEERIAQLNEFIDLAKARFEAGKELIDQGVIAEFNSDFVSAENLYQQNQNERTTLFASLEALSAKEEELTSSTIALEAQNKNLRSQLESLRTQLANLKLTDLQANTQRQNQIDDLKRDILNLEAQIAKESLVISTYEGTVMTISANPGEYVQVGTPLGTLRVDDNENLEVQTFAFFTPEDANRIRQGMAAEVSPHLLTNRRFGGTREQYGAIPSEVIWVSSKTVTSQEVASIVGDSELADALIQNPVPYAIPDSGRAQNLPVVQVALELKTEPNNPSGYKWTQGKGPDGKIPEGALGEARVTVGERPLISYAISSLRWLTGIYEN